MCTKKLTFPGFEIGVTANELGTTLMDIYDKFQRLTLEQIMKINDDYNNRVFVYVKTAHSAGKEERMDEDQFNRFVVCINSLIYDGGVTVLDKMGRDDKNPKVGLGIGPPPPCDCSECPGN